MATSVNVKKILDLKKWEMATPAPANTAVGAHIISSNLDKQLQLFVQAGTVHYLYRPDEDAWLQIPSGAFGTLAAGSCGVHHPNGPTGTATAGSASTITTALTIPGDLTGYTIRITGGAGAGQEGTIASNTQGANAVITVSRNWTVNPDATSTFLLITGRFYVLVATGAAVAFKYYDVATNAWTSLSVTSGPATTWGTDGRMVATPGWLANFSTGASSGSNTTTTLNATSKAWAASSWINYQVRITSGTGAGQVRTIAANTTTQLTVSAAWSVTPDATSNFVIEGNDDFIYLMGNNAVTLFRYSISGNTWATLTPTAARAGVAAAGVGGSWVYAATLGNWTAETNIKNGRYIYSFRGGATSTLDVYDIVLNTWVSGVAYQRAQETFTTGTSYALVGDYIYMQKDATGRYFRFNVPYQTMDPWTTNLLPQGAAVVGDKCFDVEFTDGGTTVVFIYNLPNTGNQLMRCMVV